MLTFAFSACSDRLELIATQSKDRYTRHPFGSASEGGGILHTHINLHIDALCAGTMCHRRRFGNVCAGERDDDERVGRIRVLKSRSEHYKDIYTRVMSAMGCVQSPNSGRS